MTKKIQISLTLTALITFCHWGMNDDNNSIDGSGKRPSVNFIGKIADNSASNRKFLMLNTLLFQAFINRFPFMQNHKIYKIKNMIHQPM